MAARYAVRSGEDPLRAKLIATTAACFALAVLGSCAQVEPVPTFAPPVAEPVEIEPLPPLPIERPPESTVSEASDEMLALGKYLFFDRALSGDQRLNCAECHVPELAWTDGIELSNGYPSTLYFRNTPTLLNTGQKEVFFWDGRIADLPTVVRDHVAEAHFMHADGRLVTERLRQKPQYVDLFEDVFGGPPTYGRMLNAVAAYVASLQSTENDYDRFLAGTSAALSSQAQDGLTLFGRHCVVCHDGDLFTDGEYHFLGVPENETVFEEALREITLRRFFRTLGVSEYATLTSDVGRFALTQEDADRAQFITPSLLEVAQTAPYMHNGVFETLEEVVAFYSEGGGRQSELRPLNLSASEQSALVAFLEALSSELPEIELPETPEYQVMKLGASE